MISSKSAELKFNLKKYDNSVSVKILCHCASSKPKEYVKEGYDKEIWDVHLTIECGVASGYEVGYENCQFKSFKINEVNRRWQKRFEFLSFIINDFNKNYRV